MTFFSVLALEFHFVPHALLLGKLGSPELSGGYADRYRSYVANRQSQAHVSETLSWHFELHSSVPERCIPGILLFDVFINGLCFAITYFTYLIFAERSWLRHSATSRKVAGSNPDEVIGLFSIYLIFQPHSGPGVDLASNRNEYQEYSWNVLRGKGRPALKADNITAIYEPIV
jgi:hypothetical protein